MIHLAQFNDLTCDAQQYANTAGKIEGSLVGWLQVRDMKNRKNYLQVVDPAPKGPFRKAPWHNGTFHVLKL